MRAGPLSDRRVIDVLNRDFVCVYIDNEDYVDSSGSAPGEERAELQRIRQEGFAKNLDVGNVRAYVLTPDGHMHEVLNQTANLLAMLERAVEQFKPTPGKPVVAPGGQSVPPASSAEAVLLHLISRGDDRGSWGQFPAENWIVLERAAWLKLLPTGDISPGKTWELDRDTTARILTYFYPQTENNDTSLDRLQEYSLAAKVLTVTHDQVIARIDGYVRMQHAFYPGRAETQPLAAEIVGVLRFTPGRLSSLQLVTTRAQHGRRTFTVAVRTIPQRSR